MSKGIDYGMGQTNIDRDTGIRFGVISMDEVTQAWCDSSEGDYGSPHCPSCGNEAVDADSDIDADTLAELADEYRKLNPDTDPDVGDMSRDDFGYECRKGACGDYACDSCRTLFDGEDAFGDEPLCHYIDDGEYKASQGQDDSDIFILKSPYFTRAAFCSPCAPGACYLTDPQEDGERAYCFAADWFDDETPCPYPVYSVATGELLYSPPAE